MWLMMLSGLGMIVTAMVRYYKENNAGNVVPDFLHKEQNNVPQEKSTISTIQAELVPPRID